VRLVRDWPYVAENVLVAGDEMEKHGRLSFYLAKNGDLGGLSGVSTRVREKVRVGGTGEEHKGPGRERSAGGWGGRVIADEGRGGRCRG